MPTRTALSTMRNCGKLHGEPLLFLQTEPLKWEIAPEIADVHRKVKKIRKSPPWIQDPAGRLELGLPGRRVAGFQTKLSFLKEKTGQTFQPRQIESFASKSLVMRNIPLSSVSVQLRLWLKHFEFVTLSTNVSFRTFLIKLLKSGVIYVKDLLLSSILSRFYLCLRSNVPWKLESVSPWKPLSMKAFFHLLLGSTLYSG